jgi:hypothetical protein
MSLAYGYVKAKIVSDPVLKSSRHSHEIQYHLHCNLLVEPTGPAHQCRQQRRRRSVEIKFVFDFHHSIIQTLNAAAPSSQELTGTAALPALDFMRSDLLADTGKWRDSDVMEGSDTPEPCASMKRMLSKANQQAFDVYVFGRFYSEGDGIHDTHMNQGSTKSFIHRPGDDSNDHNDVWQDGAVIVNVGEPEWVGYFAAFNQQVPPLDLWNPLSRAATI